MSQYENLQGVYGGLPTPWKPDGTFDPDSLVENVRRCAQVGVHGVYILSPAGEFWSVELPEFKDIVAVFRQAVREAAIQAQVFCGWHNLDGVIRRIEYCCELGFPVVQVGLPSWYGLNRREIIRFFAELSRACPEIKLMHYNTPKQNWLLDADDYLRLLEVAPNLVATKSISWNIGEVVDLVRRTPQLAHFYPEAVLLPAMMAGAKGCCSSAIFFHPKSMLRLYEAILQRRYEEAVHLTTRYIEFLRRTEAVFNEYGAEDAVYDKLVGHLTGFLRIRPHLRPPHVVPIPEEGVSRVRCILNDFPEWNWSASGELRSG